MDRSFPLWTKSSWSVVAYGITTAPHQGTVRELDEANEIGMVINGFRTRSKREESEVKMIVQRPFGVVSHIGKGERSKFLRAGTNYYYRSAPTAQNPMTSSDSPYYSLLFNSPFASCKFPGVTFSSINPLSVQVKDLQWPQHWHELI